RSRPQKSVKQFVFRNGQGFAPGSPVDDGCRDFIASQHLVAAAGVQVLPIRHGIIGPSPWFEGRNAELPLISHSRQVRANEPLLKKAKLNGEATGRIVLESSQAVLKEPILRANLEQQGLTNMQVIRRQVLTHEARGLLIEH